MSDPSAEDLPKYDEMYRDFLTSLEDGTPRRLSEIADAIRRMRGIPEDLARLTYPGGGNIFKGRVGWIKTYLKKAGLIEQPGRGVSRITPEGQKVLQSPAPITNELLDRYPAFHNFRFNRLKPDVPASADPSAPGGGSNPDSGPAASACPDESGLTPQETIESVMQTLHEHLIRELQERLLALDPYDFERLVIKLLLHMGYGTREPGCSILTSKSNDEGIDGIIAEDKLGFSHIYIQAKRWKDTSIGRPELQRFVGALTGKGATKGLFITTADFSESAQRYAREQHACCIVLVSGRKLAELMIEYNIGVSVETSYEIKRIDNDFFDEDAT